MFEEGNCMHMTPCNYIHACTTVNMFVEMCVCMHMQTSKQKYDVKHKINAEKKDVKQSSPYV